MLATGARKKPQHCPKWLGSADLKRGLRKGATSKNFRNIFDIFRAGQKNVVSKSFSKLFENFRAAPVFRPLLGASDRRGCTRRFGHLEKSSSGSLLHKCKSRFAPVQEAFGPHTPPKHLLDPLQPLWEILSCPISSRLSTLYIALLQQPNPVLTDEL